MNRFGSLLTGLVLRCAVSRTGPGVVYLLAAVQLVQASFPAAGILAAPPRVGTAAVVLPCDGYLESRAARRGSRVASDARLFASLVRMVDRIERPAGSEVRSVAAGMVVYSDHVSSWHGHPNPGHVVIVEHALPGLTSLLPVCSVYAQLGPDRRVKLGDRVARGQPLGTVGSPDSRDLMGAAAGLLFGLHRGPYCQIAPSWRAEIERRARSTGLPFGVGGALVKGPVELRPEGGCSARVTFTNGGASGVLSLLVGRAAPESSAELIIGWCRLHGTQGALAEWIDPESWFEEHQNTTAGGDPPLARGFTLPCERYHRGLRGRGNFGAYISRGSSPFSGSYHLAEDVWLQAGTEVTSVAAGKVVYSDFSPTWTDAAGRKHWNLGNVIVIEHQLAAPDPDLEFVCSVYVHLGTDRRVRVGQVVTRGQVIGTIGKDRSAENGRYPAHLHFGLHRGPYHQIAPAWRRDLIATAEKVGLPFGPDREIVKGAIELTRTSVTEVLVEFVGQQARGTLSLLTGSTAPDDPPADIMGWCNGYGTRDEVSDWLAPASWLAAHAGRPDED